MPKKKTTKARKGKQFGGGMNQPLGGGRLPVRSPVGPPIRPPGFKHGKSAKKK